MVQFFEERQLTIIKPTPPRNKPPKNQPNALLPLLCAMIGHRIILTTVTMTPKLEANSIAVPPEVPLLYNSARRFTMHQWFNFIYSAFIVVVFDITRVNAFSL